MRLFFLTSFFCIIAACLSAKVELMPLADVKAGMEGEWVTSIKGTELKRFNLRVVGIAEHFAGPRHSVIICEALDREHIVSGPVGGMSGSPVYIDGKLVGAYAYGFVFAKEQALLGVTPIHQMLDVWDQAESPKTRRPKIKSESLSDNGWKFKSTNGQFSEQHIKQLMKVTPAPLVVSGVSQKVLDAFSDQWNALGVQPMIAPMGQVSGSAQEWIDSKMEPGMPVAGVMMSGDFSVAGVGTITWRDGDRLLGFGHPFMQSGNVDMPMAGAEILTVVQSVYRSFKLSNTGPIVGTITQDRLTAIGGKLGEYPDMTEVDYHLQNPDGKKVHYQAKLYQQKDMSPLLLAMGSLEMLSNTMSLEAEQQFQVDITLEIEGMKDVKWSRYYSNPMSLAMECWIDFALLWNNRYGVPDINRVKIEVVRSNDWGFAQLDKLQLRQSRVLPGRELDVDIMLRNYQQDAVTHKIKVPIPERFSGESLTLLIADATKADEVDHGNPSKRSDRDDFNDIVNHLKNKRTSNAVYVKLLRNAPGIRLQGETLSGLPESVVSIYKNTNSLARQGSVKTQTVWEQRIELPVVFHGSTSKTLKVE